MDGRLCLLSIDGNERRLCSAERQYLPVSTHPAGAFFDFFFCAYFAIKLRQHVSIIRNCALDGGRYGNLPILLLVCSRLPVGDGFIFHRASMALAAIWRLPDGSGMGVGYKVRYQFRVGLYHEQQSALSCRWRQRCIEYRAEEVAITFTTLPKIAATAGEVVSAFDARRRRSHIQSGRRTALQETSSLTSEYRNACITISRRDE